MSLAEGLRWWEKACRKYPCETSEPIGAERRRCDGRGSGREPGDRGSSGEARRTGFYDHVQPPRVIDDTSPKTSTTPVTERSRLTAADPGLQAARIPRSGDRDLKSGAPQPSGPAGSVRTRLLAEADRDHLRVAPAHREGQARAEPEPEPGPGPGRGTASPDPVRAIPTSREVPGPKNDASAACSAKSVQSVSPPPVREGSAPAHPQPLVRSGWPTGSGMAGLGKELRQGEKE